MMTGEYFKHSVPKSILRENDYGTLYFGALPGDEFPRRLKKSDSLYKQQEYNRFKLFKEYYIKQFNLSNEEDVVEYGKICQGAANGFIKIVERTITPVVDENKKVNINVYIEFFARILIEP